MTRTYFGTDGIRGRVGGNVINIEFVLKLGWAIGTLFAGKEAGVQPRVLIGKDTRLSGMVLELALQAGLIAGGVRVQSLNVMPTPAIAYLTRSMGAAAGVVISASHNPYTDNGIKIFDGNGMKLSDAQEAQIESLLHKPLKMDLLEHLDPVPVEVIDAEGRYIEFCKQTFPRELSLSGLRIFVDAAHGAGYRVAPAVFRELGAEVREVACQPTGTNINERSGALHVDVLAETVKYYGADIGIALDGDGDRVLLVDEKGVTLDGDEILAILAKDKADRCSGVVGTLMTNLGFEQAMAAVGIKFERAKVGDRYVLEQLIRNGWTLGGEASGHIIDLDYMTTGDGIITALQVLRIMQAQHKPLSELKRVMQKRPQLLRNVHFSGDRDIINHPKIREQEALMTKKLDGRGRILLRVSGTEPLLRVMVEGDDEAEISQVVEVLAETVKKVSRCLT